MDSKDNIKNSKIREYEISLEEIIYDSFLDDFDMDKQVVEKVYLVGYNWLKTKICTERLKIYSPKTRYSSVT